jgi:hypothetical protein
MEQASWKNDASRSLGVEGKLLNFPSRAHGHVPGRRISAVASVCSDSDGWVDLDTRCDWGLGFSGLMPEDHQEGRGM